MKAVVIGTGPAGLTAAATIRAIDPGADITALSAEPYPPYSPPAMADHFLTGRTGPLYWQGEDVAARLGLEERRGETVVAVDTDNREVVGSGGDRLPYERLVIASGSRLHAPLPGAELPGVLDFKSLSTAEKLIGMVRSGEATTALIVGNGFIGIELALLLADLGVDVTVIGRRPWVMPRVLDRETSKVAEAALVRRGIDLQLGVEASAFVGNGSVSGVQMATGNVLTADLYVAATGVKPHVEFLAGSGVAAGWGVHVDERMATSAPGVYAAGDVAEAADWLTGERYVHAIFANAVSQARVAASNACGRPARHDGAEAMNSLKHLGVPIVAMGTVEEPHEVHSRRERDVLRTVYVRDGRIVGVQLAGDIRGAGVYHSLMLRRQDVSRYGDRIVDPAFGPAELVWAAVHP